MKKIIFSISFYTAAFSAMVLILDTTSLFYKFIGFWIIFCLMAFAKTVGAKSMISILGIDWLKKMFKNNPVIMDMTNE